MKVKKINIENGAILVADVHYKKGDKAFLNFLKNLEKNPPPQLFLLGDIFHLLLPFKYLKEYNKDAIDLINKIAKKSEVYYAIGNHDFWIEDIFENVVVSEGFEDKKKSIFLTHGDLNESDFFYKIYCKVIRNKFFLKFLNILSLNFLNNYIFKKILKKEIKCSKIPDFKTKILKKIADIDYKIIIEGHYHQNILYNIGKKYFNLGAFKCEKCYYTFRDNNLKEKKYE